MARAVWWCWRGARARSRRSRRPAATARSAAPPPRAGRAGSSRSPPRLGRIVRAESRRRVRTPDGRHLAVLRRDRGTRLPGRAARSRVVAAGRGVVGDGAPPSRPRRRMTASPPSARSHRVSSRPVSERTSMRPVAPLADEVAVVPAALIIRLAMPERERAVGAGPHAQPDIGLAGEPDVARIDDDQLHPALERRRRWRSHASGG